MSVKVYTGFKFVQRELSGIVGAMDTVKARIEALQRKQFLTAYADIFVSMMDRSRQAVAVGKTEGMVSGMPGSLVRRAILKRQAQVRATRERDPAVDFEVVLPCWHSRHLGEVVGYVYGEFSTPVLALLREAGVATEYGYWDIVDPDEDVSPQEWAQRKTAWNEVLDRKSGMGFQFRFDGEYASLPFKWEELVPHLPDLAHRARELAEPSLFQRWHDELPEKREDKADIWQLHSQFRKRLREDPSAKQQFADEVERISPLLMSSDELDKTRRCSQLVFPPCDD